ncbi:replication initiator protein A [Deinococcus aquatilis]|uniref:replication initiator protein A n=1 Tax=Deinococcus aquatilis TaxID=519440 RepID=UPI0003765FC1|nr:replication initiator protein A [Deinococcus aquatilis]
MEIRISEIDLTRAGIISVQRDLSPTETTWEVDYTIGEVMYRVTGSAFHGRPRGRDADILLALQTFFFRSGCPDSNGIEVTAAQILTLSGHARNGQYYTGLRDSLLRLGGVKWTMIRTQWDEKEQRHLGTTITTGIIAEMQVMDQATGSHRPFASRELSDTSHIKITFVPSFAASIRAGLFQILDGELLSRLGQPQARSLYRVLQAHRVTPDGSLARELTFSLRDWFGACGLEDERTDNAKRTLDLAHERLKGEAYLHEAIYKGRGKAGSITYTFLAAPEPELVDRLLDRGVTRPVAEALAADHPQRIVPALRVIDERLGTGWKPRSIPASVVDAIRNPGKWGYAVTDNVSKAPARSKAGSSEGAMDDLPSKPRETARVLLKLKLGRVPSVAAAEAIDQLSEDGLSSLLDALKRTKDQALPLVRALLSVDL